MSEKATKSKWVPKNSRFVGFLDILGFKNLVMRSTHDEIYEKLLRISKTKKMLEETSVDTNKISQWGDAEIRIVNFSDSIVVFSKNDDFANFRYFLVALRWLLADCIKNGIPVKGGIAHGEISINKDQQIYFGQAIIDAYNIEEEVDYHGITCHNSIDQYIFNRKSELDMDIVSSLLFEDAIPLKSGRIKHLNVNWFAKAYSFKNVGGIEEIKLSIQKNIEKLRISVSGSPRRYIDNTISVFEKINIEQIAEINKKHLKK